MESLAPRVHLCISTWNLTYYMCTSCFPLPIRYNLSGYHIKKSLFLKWYCFTYLLIILFLPKYFEDFLSISAFYVTLQHQTACIFVYSNFYQSMANLLKLWTKLCVRDGHTLMVLSFYFHIGILISDQTYHHTSSHRRSSKQTGFLRIVLLRMYFVYLMNEIV